MNNETCTLARTDRDYHATLESWRHMIPARETVDLLLKITQNRARWIKREQAEAFLAMMRAQTPRP